MAAVRGQLFTAENLPSLPFLGPWLLGNVTRILGSVELTFVLADFFLPAFIFYLLYRLARLTQISHGVGLAAALASLFLYQLTTKINPALWLQPMFFNFNRLIPPQLTFIFFLLFLISLYRRSVLVGVWAGLLAYIYFYHWSAALVILAIFCWFTKSRKLLAGLLLAGIISAAYFYQASQATLEQQLRFGRLEGRFLEPLTTFRYLLMIGLVYFSRLSGITKKFFISVFSAAIILMNLQLVTGFTIASGHWPSSTFEPLVPLALVVVLSRWVKKRRRLIIGLILVYALINQVRISRQWQSMYWLTPREQELFTFFNQQEGNPVVLTLDKRLNFYLPVLSKAKLYLPYGSYSSLSNDELWQRFNCAMVLSRLNQTEIEATLADTQIIGHLFDLTYNQKLTVFSFGKRQLPESLKAWSREQLAQGPACPFPVDYVILKDGSLYDPRH